MSSDAIVAAQFWLWPDPVMKRDAQGRILFINAAFLQLYGGSVETWTGNALQGWPAPHPMREDMNPTPHRFETRIASQDPTQSEQVYDWIEQTEADGSAFALARNVSVFIKEAVTQEPPSGSPPGQPMYYVEQAVSHQTEPETPRETTPTHETEYANSDYASPEYTDEEPVQYVTDTASVETTPPAKEPEAPLDISVQSVAHEAERPEMERTEDTQPEDAAHDFEADLEIAPKAQASEEQPKEQEEPRFERRALPLENNSAVLGNNWRDAVIARAVGVEMPQQNTPVSQPLHEPQTSEGPDGPKRILLAEDNAINALLTRTLLEAEGHTVETVEDGALAVEAMKSQHFDLIFMDMRMPNMDGLESTRKIRQLPNVPKDLPIIALTANAFDDDRNACFDSGMNDFMTKPVSAEELSVMVKNWTGKKEMQMAG